MSNFWLHLPLALLVGAYVTALTLISRDETQAQRPQLLLYSGAVMTASTAAYIGWIEYRELATTWAVGILVVALMLVWYRLTLLLRHYRPKNIQSIVMFLVLGLIPLDAILLFISGYFIAGLIVLLFVFPGRALARRLYVT